MLAAKPLRPSIASVVQIGNDVTINIEAMTDEERGFADDIFQFVLLSNGGNGLQLSEIQQTTLSSFSIRLANDQVYLLAIAAENEYG